MMKEIVLAVFCGLTIAMATPVLPERDLGEIDPIDSCLFLCNICFNEDVNLMMKCANRVCLSEHMVTEYSLYVIKQLCPLEDEHMEKYVNNGMKH